MQTTRPTQPPATKSASSAASTDSGLGPEESETRSQGFGERPGDGEYKTYADVKSNDGGNTTERITYELTDTLTLVDNRGCSVMNEYETGEIFAQLGNLLPLNEQVSWSKGIGLVDRIVEAERYVQSSDFIYPIFIYSVKKGLTDDEALEAMELLTTAKKLTGPKGRGASRGQEGHMPSDVGVRLNLPHHCIGFGHSLSRLSASATKFQRTLVVSTPLQLKKLKIYCYDGICPVVILTHKTHSGLRHVRAKFEDMDVERIFALENFTPEDHLMTRGKHEDVLKLYIEVIKDIEFRMERMSSPEDERETRKQFVLNFVYQRELRKKEAEVKLKLREEARVQEMKKEKQGPCKTQSTSQCREPSPCKSSPERLAQRIRMPVTSIY
ncbi:uncharacterized protein ACNLHF_024992 [Anomaloglossus baeobatrachus]